MKLLTGITIIALFVCAGGGPAAAGYSIQVGAFRFENNARALADNYRALSGEPVFVDGSDGIYRVRIGDYPAAQRAKLHAEQLQREGKIPAFCIIERNSSQPSTPVAVRPGGAVVIPQPDIRQSGAGGATTAVGTLPAPGTAPTADIPATPVEEDVTVGLRVADFARKFEGIPYVYGGNTIFGLDCSGFTRVAYYLAGVSIPRVAQDQFNFGREVPRDSLKPGDLVFFGTGPDNVGHVGMYIGDDKFVHARPVDHDPLAQRNVLRGPLPGRPPALPAGAGRARPGAGDHAAGTVTTGAANRVYCPL